MVVMAAVLSVVAAEVMAAAHAQRLVQHEA